MSDITVTSETYGTLCICAVRYALGRQTYMPDEVATAVLQALDKLPDNDLMVLLRDIKAYLLKPNGDVNDKVWYKLGNRLFDEMDRRNEQRQRVAPDDHQDYTDTHDEWARRAGVRSFRIPNETKRPESLLRSGADTANESRDTLYAINMHPDPDTGLVDCGCGGSAGAWEKQTTAGVKHYVECDKCEISTGDYDTPQAAITAWNTAMCSSWVKTSDRLPTREDANKDLRVLAKVANDGTVKGVRFEELSWIELGGDYYFSHWMKLPEVEG